MSGAPSCATTEPSGNSTMPWMIDCGCTSTSISSGVEREQIDASITSRPLFIIVAELMVIFWPMDQFGCFSACCERRLLDIGGAQVRNGPPEAVMMTRTVPRACPTPSAWNSALCSESTGRMQAPAFAARCMKKSPAQTRHSLLASATVAPRSTAASAGFSPAAPLTAAITQSAGRAAASMTALSPAAAFDARAGQRVLELAEARGIGDRRKARAELAGELRQRLDIAVRGQRLDAVALARAAQQIDRAVADRAGRAQHRHAAHGATPRPCCYAMEQRS